MMERNRREAAWREFDTDIFAPDWNFEFGQPGGNAPVQWLLRDTYSDDRAAGAINGTACDTGQLRTATDGNSKLTLANGLANVATGGVGAGDPGLWYPAQTRFNGMVLLGNVSMAANVMEFGWDTAAAGSIAFAIRPSLAGLMGVRDNGGVVLVNFQANGFTPYVFAVGLRSNGGAWYWVKGGILTKWRLIWTSPSGTANLLPGFANTGTTDTYNVDDLRIPNEIYIPDPIASDYFTRSNGALGSTEASGPDGQTIVPIVWQFTTGVWAVNGNKAVATPTPGADVIVNGDFAVDANWTKGGGWTIGSGTANAAAATSDLTAAVPPLVIDTWYQVQYTLSGYSAGSIQARLGGTPMTAQAVNGTYTQVGRCAGSTDMIMRGAAGFTGSIDNLSSKPITPADMFTFVQTNSSDILIDVAVTLTASNASRPAGLILNADSIINPRNFILVYLNGTGAVLLDEVINGVYTNKFLTGISYSAGGGLRAIRDGTNIQVYYNGATVNSATVTASTNTLHGMFSPSPLNSLDFFTIWAAGVENQYSGLDRYLS